MNRRNILTLITGLVLALVIWPEAPARTQPSPDGMTDYRRREKARYYYMEGARLEALDMHDGAAEMYRRAAEIDPTFVEARYQRGLGRIRNNNDSLGTPEARQVSLGMLREYIDTYPADFAENYYYAYVADALDSTREAVRVFSRLADIKPDKTNLLLHLSEAYMRLDSMDKAIEALHKFERIEGESVPLTLRLVNYRLQKRDSVGARREIDRYYRLKERDPQANILMAQYLESFSPGDSVLYYLQKADSLAPQSGPVKMAFADYYMAAGDTTAYDAAIYEALQTEDLDMNQKLEIFRHFLAGMYRTRASAARIDNISGYMRSQYPYEPAVLTLCGDHAVAQKRYDEGAELYSYAIDLNPSGASYDRLARQRAMLMGDKFETVLEYYKLDAPNIASADTLHIMRDFAAMAAAELDRKPEAIGYMRSIISDIAPGLPANDSLISLKNLPPNISYEDLQALSNAYQRIADLNDGADQLEQAYVNYENSLLVFPDNFLTLNNYAYRLSENGGDLEKAERMSKRVLDSPVGNNPIYTDTYAWILYRMGRYEEAKIYMDIALAQAAEAGIESAEYFDHYGDILMKLGDKAGARDAWKHALELDPDSKTIRAKLH